MSACQLFCSLFKSKEGKWASTGDPTEVALQVFVSKLGHGRSSLTATEAEGGESNKEVGHPSKRFTLKEEFPFNSDVKLMSTIYIDQNAAEGSSDRVVVFLKGAVRY
jgi:P-type Na+/K+ transporter